MITVEHYIANILLLSKMSGVQWILEMTNRSRFIGIHCAANKTELTYKNMVIFK